MTPSRRLAAGRRRGMMAPMRAALALVLVALGLAAAGLVSGAAWAGQDDPRLPALFTQLKTVRAPAQAEAIQQVIWSIWTESDNPEVNLLMLEGIDAMNQGDSERALKAFDSMVEVAPNFAEGWNKRATVLFSMHDFSASVANIQKTLQLEPHHWGALSGLGQIYVALGDEEAALRAFNRALEINPHLESLRSAVEQLQAKLEKKRI